MPKWYARPGYLQGGLALLAVLYLASLWLFPTWNPAIGLALVLGLAGLGGLYTFVVSLRVKHPPSPSVSEPGPHLPATGQHEPPTPVASLPGGLPRVSPREFTASDEAMRLPVPDGQPIVTEAPPALAAHNPQATALRLRSRQQIASLRTAWRAAHRAGDRGAEAACLLELGNAYRHAGEPRRANLYYHLCVVCARLVGERRAEATALGNMGLAHADLGETQQAVEFYEQHLVLVRQLGDRPAEARASWNLGLAYWEIGDLARAVTALQVCVDFECAIGHPDAGPDAAWVEQLRAQLAT